MENSRLEEVGGWLLDEAIIYLFIIPFFLAVLLLGVINLLKLLFFLVMVGIALAITWGIWQTDRGLRRNGIF